MKRFPAIILFLAVLSLPFPVSPEEGLRSESMTVRFVFVPHRQATLSAQVHTTVEKISKELGQTFEAEETLLQLDETIIKANFDKADAQWRGALSNLERQKRLHKDSSISEVELEMAEISEKVAKANRNAAVKELDVCRVRSVYKGRVSALFVNEMEVVQPGMRLMEIVDDTVLTAHFFVPSKWLNRIKVGREFNLQIEDAGAVVKAKISHVGAVVEPVTSRVKVTADVVNESGRFKAGMKGDLDLASFTQDEEKKYEQERGADSNPG